MADLLRRLGASVLLSPDELEKLIRSAPHRYKVYEIPKRTPGGTRTIAQPAREVKALQYWLMRHLLDRCEIHPAATAYRAHLSTADNAHPHRASRFLLKMDFRAFFPSIGARDFILFAKRSDKLGLDAATAEAVSRILFWKPKGQTRLCLSIGAPSSPMVSNILMADFDRRLAAVCERHQVVYTRYADDLTFSAAESRSLGIIEAAVFDLCGRMRSPRLTVNQAKTARLSKRDSRRVTGLILTNDRKISLGRDLKRTIRATVHHFATNRLDDSQAAHLRGMLSYVNSVEPQFLRRLRGRFGDDTIDRCLSPGRK